MGVGLGTSVGTPVGVIDRSPVEAGEGTVSGAECWEGAVMLAPPAGSPADGSSGALPTTKDVARGRGEVASGDVGTRSLTITTPVTPCPSGYDVVPQCYAAHGVATGSYVPTI